MKTFCYIGLIPTPNTNNYYSNLYDDNDDEEDKIIFHSNLINDVTTQIDPLTDDSSTKSIEFPKQETLFNTPKIKIEFKQAIAGAGSKGNFILPGAPLKHIQPSNRPLVVHLPYGKTLQYTHTGNLDLPWLSKEGTRAHVVLGLSNTSYVSIKMLCNAGCKVSYEKEK